MLKIRPRVEGRHRRRSTISINLGNRRVRSVGELMENQYPHWPACAWNARLRERMSSVDIDTVMPHDLVNAKPVGCRHSRILRLLAAVAVHGSDQSSELKSPISAVCRPLDPGGLTRERAGFEVRDVHPTHYGRICPIETPEGPNIGLINSMATYAQASINTASSKRPYRKVSEWPACTDEAGFICRLSKRSANMSIAQANSPHGCR